MNEKQREPGREETIVIYRYQYDIVFTMFLTKKRKENNRERVIEGLPLTLTLTVGLLIGLIFVRNQEDAFYILSMDYHINLFYSGVW
jgi:hypothetical protein